MKIHGASLVAILMLSWCSYAYSDDLGETKGSAGLDFSACSMSDTECLLAIKNAETVRLIHDKEALDVEADRSALSMYNRQNEHTIASLWAQYYASLAVMIMVFIIVGIGLVMSWKHMEFGFAEKNSIDNTFEVGKDGLKLKSPVIGLFIFIGSIYFFSIYVDKVYTITSIRGSAMRAELENQKVVSEGK
ncbi:MAG: hypothetical protein QM808_05880 [Steroidobacteraceae bacterium]